MRLISNFRDFYDGAQGTDREPAPVFVRNTEETLIPWEDKKRLAELEPFTSFADREHMPWIHEFDNVGVDRVRVAFCGKGYAFYRWQERLFVTPMDLEAYARGLPEQESHPALPSNRKLLVRAFDRLEAGQAWDAHSAPLPTKKGWERSDFKNVVDLPSDLFRQEGTPMLSWGSQMDSYHAYHAHGRRPGTVLVKNPNLQLLGLHRWWTVGWVWQELDMYLGNQMASQFDPASARTDELARDYHGFDAYSFKNTAPGQKKARRQANKQHKQRQGQP
jgi:hypothetical protein